MRFSLHNLIMTDDSPKLLDLSFDELPDDILKLIFSNFSMEELIRYVLPVSRKWSIVGSDHTLWRNLIFEGNGISTHSICNILRIASSLKSISLIEVPKTDVIITELCRSNTLLKEVIVKQSPCHIKAELLVKLLRKCPALEKIKFKETTFSSDNLYKYLISLKHLRSVTFSINDQHLDENRLMELLLNCYKLEELCLYNYTATKPVLSDRLMVLIIEKLTSSLRTIKLDCSATDAATYNAILKCHRLETLCLKNAISFSSKEFKCIPLKLHLKKLKIDHAHNLTNDDILDTFHPNHCRMANLTTLRLSHVLLEDSGLLRIIQICGTNLIHLCLDGCKDLSSDALMNAMKICSNLKYFGVAFIASVSDIVLYEAIPEYLPHLYVIVVDKTINHDHLTYLTMSLPTLKIIISEASFYKQHTVFSVKPSTKQEQFILKLAED